MTRQRLLTVTASALTVLGIFAGTAVLGGDLSYAGTVPLAFSLGGLVLLMRRWPVASLIAAILIVDALRYSDLTDSGWVWPATALFAGAVLAGRLGWAIGVGAYALTAGWVWEWTGNQLDASTVIGRVGTEALWLAATIAATYAYRNWRRWQAEVVARIVQSGREQEAEAARRRADERVRIAHDLHDVVAHTLAVVGVHLNVAADALDTEPDEARDALRLAQQVRGKAMTDLKSLIGVLRDVDADDAPAADLTAMADLVARMRATGLEVTLDESGDPAAVPAPVALAAYRVTQEALTNTVRHAHATAVTVSLRYDNSEVRVTVADNGRGPDEDSATGGHGLAGMRERVAALGGWLRTGPGPAGGYLVDAAIPVTGVLA